MRADDKRETHLIVIKDLLSRFEYGSKNRIRDLPDPNLTFLFDRAALERGLMATPVPIPR